MSGEKPRLVRPSARLIEHDVRIRLQLVSPGVAEVIATVECERRGCTLDVERCAYCERFARIEVHEGGYTMLCRSADLSDDEDFGPDCGRPTDGRAR